MSLKNSGLSIDQNEVESFLVRILVVEGLISARLLDLFALVAGGF